MNEGMEPMQAPHETEAIAQRYARRQVGDRYSFLRAEVWKSVHERQAAMLELFSQQLRWSDVSDKKLVEVGSGAGGNLLELLRVGFAPQNLTGLELLPERVAFARHQLPSGVSLWEGNAAVAPIEPASQDVVFQSVVFSSLLDDDFQQQLARAMWDWLRPGGGILWYDFIYDNPSNADVRGVPLRRVRELFPAGEPQVRRVTLAPPIARRVVRIHPALYGWFNTLPWLRTHVLCWIQKP